VIAGLDMAAAHTREEVLCTSDSELVVRKMNGSYRLRSPNMKKLFVEVKAKEQMFEKVSYRHRPRLSQMSC
jgi:ribonuclease HI